MAGKKKHHATGQNIKSNIVKRLEKAKRENKSKNYIADLEVAASKRY